MLMFSSVRTGRRTLPVGLQDTARRCPVGLPGAPAQAGAGGWTRPTLPGIHWPDHPPMGSVRFGRGLVGGPVQVVHRLADLGPPGWRRRR